MYDLLNTVIAELKGWWRFRWIGMAVAWSVCLGGWLYVYGLPNSYESRATIYVDTNSALRPLLGNLTVNPDVLSQVELVTTSLLGRSQLESVARKTDLHLRANSPEAMDSLIAGMRTRTIIANLPRESPNLWLIRYRDSDRRTAQ